MEKKKINAVDLLLSKLDREQIEDSIRTMKARYPLLLILSVLSLVMTGCGNDEDVAARHCRKRRHYNAQTSQ